MNYPKSNLSQALEYTFAPTQVSSPTLEAAGQGLGVWCAGIGERKALLPGDMNITHSPFVRPENFLEPFLQQCHHLTAPLRLSLAVHHVVN